MYNPSAYGDGIADIYDDLYGNAPLQTIDVLADVAGPGGRAVELGIGTGRVALPLVNRGIRVHGIDASQSMLDRLREKAGGREIPVTVGDFADVGQLVTHKGPFDLAFCTFNTFFALLTQDDQVRCFEGTFQVLAPKGRFLLELFVPDPTRFEKHQPALVGGFTDEEVLIEASRHDSVAQRVSSRLVSVRNGAVKVIPVEIRYVWPSELDLMARLAGFRLLHRWAGWDRRPFGAGAGKHISVYEKV